MSGECEELVGMLKRLLELSPTDGATRNIELMKDLALAIDEKRAKAKAELAVARKDARRARKQAEGYRQQVDELKRAASLTDAEREAIRGQAWSDGFADGEASGFGECAALMSKRKGECAR